MKIRFLIVTTFLAVFAFVIPAIACDNEDDAGSSMTVEDQDTTPNQMTFNFSPGVVATYLTPDDTGNVQEFTIGAYHEGGTLFYGTASDQATVYKKDRDTTELLAAAGFAAETAVDAGDAITAPWDEDDSGWTK